MLHWNCFWWIENKRNKSEKYCVRKRLSYCHYNGTCVFYFGPKCSVIRQKVLCEVLIEFNKFVLLNGIKAVHEWWTSYRMRIYLRMQTQFHNQRMIERLTTQMVSAMFSVLNYNLRRITQRICLSFFGNFQCQQFSIFFGYESYKITVYIFL